MGKRFADVVVIGAGIQGLSAAYNIALGGPLSTIVVEGHSAYGRESSGRSGSMLMKSRENATKISLSLYSYDRLMKFRDEFGEDLIFRRTGFINAVTGNLAPRYEAEHSARLELGVPSAKLTPREILNLSPGLRVDDLVFGLLCPDDGEIDAWQIMRALHRRSSELGVSYSYGDLAIGIEIRGGAVTAVETTRGTIDCHYVVNAAGAQASVVGSWVGVSIPITNMRRSIYIMESSDPSFQSGPMVEDAEIEWYFRPLGSQRVLVGMGLEPDGPPTDGPNLEYLDEVRQAAARRAPALSRAALQSGYSGTRPLTPDFLPIIGPVEAAEGFINSCGWGGEGIMHSPAGGSLVADWINGTNTSDIDRNAFLLKRFAPA